MEIQFFDDPLRSPKSREDVRIKQIGLFIYEDLRRVAFGVELTPFLERPSIEAEITNGENQPASSLSVIETNTPNFSLTMHLRDVSVTNPYTLKAKIYYQTPETERQDVHQEVVVFEVKEAGEQIFRFDNS